MALGCLNETSIAHLYTIVNGVHVGYFAPGYLSQPCSWARDSRFRPGVEIRQECERAQGTPNLYPSLIEGNNVKEIL